MKKRYWLPITGTVLTREPLTGDEHDPIAIVHIWDLPGRPRTAATGKGGQEIEVDEPFLYECLSYDIDRSLAEVELEASQECHDWLDQLLVRHTLDDLYRLSGSSKLEETG